MLTEDAARLTAEVARVRDEVERITGLPSRWSGRVHVVDAPDYYGRKDSDCAIALSGDIIHADSRYATELHELLHSMSCGLNETDLVTWFGLEEGVVELLAREIRAVVCATLGVRDIDVHECYPAFVEALMRLIDMTGLSALDACVELLKTLLAGREWHVCEMIARSGQIENMARAYAVAVPHLARLRNNLL